MAAKATSPKPHCPYAVLFILVWRVLPIHAGTVHMASCLCGDKAYLPPKLKLSRGLTTNFQPEAIPQFSTLKGHNALSSALLMIHFICSLSLHCPVRHSFLVHFLQPLFLREASDNCGLDSVAFAESLDTLSLLFAGTVSSASHLLFNVAPLCDGINLLKYSPVFHLFL